MGIFKIFVVLCLLFHLVQRRRVSPIPQIKCIAGSAKCAYEPDVIQCYNQGSDGIDIQWACTSEMPKQYKFGKLNVLCEGYNSPEDQYILVGSCGVEFNLELNDNLELTVTEQILLSVIILIVFIIIIIIIIIILIDADKDHGQYTPSRSSSSSNNTYKSFGYGGTKRR